MKTIKNIIIPMFALLLVTACSKESGNIRIFAENMSGDGAKVWVDPDPANVSTSATWIAGEKVYINSVEKTIIGDENGFYLDGTVISNDTRWYAVYPATTTSNGNNVNVVNSYYNGTTSVTINRLAVNFHNGGHDIIFPMAGIVEIGESHVLFNHLTGGFRLNLTATSAVTVNTVKVIVYGNSAAGAVSIDNIDYTVAWAIEGPNLPIGEVGDISGDYDVKYASVMYFDLKNNGTAGVEVNSSGTTFCVPVTVTGVRRLTVIGYDGSGNEVFVKSKELSNVNVVRNKMYNIPTIQIN